MSTVLEKQNNVSLLFIVRVWKLGHECRSRGESSRSTWNLPGIFCREQALLDFDQFLVKFCVDLILFSFANWYERQIFPNRPRSSNWTSCSMLYFWVSYMGTFFRPIFFNLLASTCNVLCWFPVMQSLDSLFSRVWIHCFRIHIAFVGYRGGKWCSSDCIFGSAIILNPRILGLWVGRHSSRPHSEGIKIRSNLVKLECNDCWVFEGKAMLWCFCIFGIAIFLRPWILGLLGDYS